MKIIHYSEAEPKLFDTLPARGVTGRVVIGRDDGADHFCMRIFELALGGHTPRHTHQWEHEIFFHSGEGAVFHRGEWAPVSAGCVAFIPPGEEHQIKNTGNSLLVFACLIPSGPPEL